MVELSRIHVYHLYTWNIYEHQLHVGDVYQSHGWYGWQRYLQLHHYSKLWHASLNRPKQLRHCSSPHSCRIRKHPNIQTSGIPIIALEVVDFQQIIPTKSCQNSTFSGDWLTELGHPGGFTCPQVVWNFQMQLVNARPSEGLPTLDHLPSFFCLPEVFSSSKQTPRKVVFFLTHKMFETPRDPGSPKLKMEVMEAKLHS